MATNMMTAKELIFGASGLGASNFKMYPGFNREVTPEMIASEIVNALKDVLEGNAEELSLEDECEETVAE